MTSMAFPPSGEISPLADAQRAAGRAGDAADKPTVLAVDDTPANLSLLSQLLGGRYRVQVATSGPKALELAARRPPNLILLDVMMPGMDGYAVCKALKNNPLTREVPVIFLTALNGAEDETRAFDAGAADFVAKPFTPATLLARVQSQLELKSWRDVLRDRNAWLQHELAERVHEVELLRETTLFVMVALAEFRDEDTGNHVQRTQAYVRELGLWMLRGGKAPVGTTEADVEAMAKASPLHDIGKVAIPDGVLLKPGTLTEEEWAVMRLHTVYGADLLMRAVNRLGEGAGAMLRYGVQIARSHHERWDGTGYPDGLKGQDIPFAARLMAVADVYDALISRRPYKDPMSHELALERVIRASGTHFDPDVVDALRSIQAQVLGIALSWKDED